MRNHITQHNVFTIIDTNLPQEIDNNYSGTSEENCCGLSGNGNIGTRKHELSDTCNSYTNKFRTSIKAQKKISKKTRLTIGKQMV